jgi:serine/threonine protein kinase/Flp pilus assembly protein TadD
LRCLHHEHVLLTILSTLAEALRERYTIERELGRGGMAIVFLARDRRHDRLVALKTLRPELIPALGPERFLREIQIAARLQHPNILPLHDSGEAEGLLYYVMPYVEGESLRSRLEREGQLPIEDALQIGRQVADALAYAHSQGVVHRDIKPENILLSGEHAVVADFGIARAIVAAGGERLTETGLAVGTAAYMSPEQAAADARLDGRSDIYALGCVVYEMLGGQPPFTGPSAQAIVARHTLDPVPPLRTLRKTVPFALDQTLLRALEKNPADRFRTASQFAEALASPAAALPDRESILRSPVRQLIAWALPLAAAAGVTVWLFGPGLGRRDSSSTGSDSMSSVAVLPMDNLTGDSTKAYLADGLTADLIDELFRIEGLRVPGSATVARYRGSRTDPTQVARELGVNAVVTGNVREIDGRPRVALQLVNANDGFVRWSGMYDQSDPKAEADIAAVLAESLRIQLRPQTRPLARSGGTQDTAAYRLYLRGRQLVHQVGQRSVRQGVQALKQAIARDSGFGAAWTALAGAYGILGQFDDPDVGVLAEQAVDRAITLDSLNGEAYVFRADRRKGWGDYAGADRDYRRAIELTPGSALSHMLYSQFLNVVARDDSALVVMRRALELEPTSPWFIANYAFRLLLVGRLDDAISEARRALQHDSTHWVAYHALAWAYRRQNQHEKAAQEAERALVAFGDSIPFMLGPLGYHLGLAGRRAEARRVLAKLAELGKRQYVSAMWTAYVRLGLGDRAGALDALEFSVRNRDVVDFHIAVGEFEALRGEPRYEAVLERMGLAEFIRNRRRVPAGRSSGAGTG